MRKTTTHTGIVLALTLLISSGPLAAQTAAVPAQPEPVPVAAAAPPAGSAQLALGAGIGVVVGLVLLAAILSSD